MDLHRVSLIIGGTLFSALFPGFVFAVLRRFIFGFGVFICLFYFIGYLRPFWPF